MRYSVGDRVRIKSLDWYNENKNEDGVVELSTHIFIPEMVEHCGMIVTIKDVFEDTDDNVVYYMKDIVWDWTDEMIEGLVEDKFESNANSITQSESDAIEKAKTYWDSIKDAWICPEGYEFRDENGNIINATKIVLEKKEAKLILESTKKVREYWSEYARIFIEIYDDEPNECVFTHLWVVDAQRRKGYGKQALMQAEEIAKELGCHIAHLKVETDSWMHKWYLRCGYKWYKNASDNYTWLTKNLNNMEKKPKYPQSYEECEKILGLEDSIIEGCLGYEYKLLNAFQKLLVCRDAYWKIAGEEMGLGKPWKPDWCDEYKIKYCIEWSYGTIDRKNMNCTKGCILAFPTEEMRDAFYEAFKGLINEVKELL